MSAQPISKERNPVWINELRSRMRGRRTFLVLAAHLFILSSLILIIYSVVYSETQSYATYYYGGAFQRMLEASANLGKSIFYGTTLLLLFVVSLVGPAFTSGAIVGEKERQTFELLVITALPAKAIVNGKLNAILVFMGLLIFATLPFQSMAYFFGGVDFNEILVANLVLILTTILFCSLGIFVSSFARSTTLANMINYLAVIPLLLGVPFMAFVFGILSSGVFYDTIFTDPPLLLAGIMTYVFLFFLSINPLSMAVTSEIFFQETGNYFFTVEKFYGYNFPILAPWVIYVVFCIIMSFIFIRIATNRVEQVSQ